MSGSANTFAQYETPRRNQSIRMPDELQLPTPQQTNYSTQSAPTLGLQQATSQSTMYATNNSALPGSLQAGGSGRPQPPQSAYTAPTTVPSVPHINTNAQQYTLPTRSNTYNASHSHSRSSPAGLEQKYIPFSGAGDSKYPQTPNQKFFQPPTPTTAATQSPLQLEQIRPRSNSVMEDQNIGGALFGDGMDRVPTNSNYLAPWPVFAFDWCKYPVPHGNSAGKMAVGSYLEDPHNFVSKENGSWRWRY